MSDLIARRDLQTGLHSRRLAPCADALAAASGLPAGEATSIGIAAGLHDLGKLAIPDAILFKPGSLGRVERELMRGHAQVGHDALAGTGLPLLDLAAQIALGHHERFDGRGYPSGLAGEEIPLPARIVAIVDVFDSLTNDRLYRRAVSQPQALEVMRGDCGTHFDPALLDCFGENLDSILAGQLNAPARWR